MNKCNVSELFSNALQLARLPEDAMLLPKVHVNLGIAMEAEGLLLGACEHYRSTPDQFWLDQKSTLDPTDENIQEELARLNRMSADMQLLLYAILQLYSKRSGLWNGMEVQLLV